MGETRKHTEELRNIEMWMKTGAISYDRARLLAAPHIAALNKKSAEIARKHGTRPRKITFAAFMR